jgi:FtsZ-binding cell division protein ZapB
MTCRIEQENEALKRRNEELEEVIVNLKDRLREMLAKVKE